MAQSSSTPPASSGQGGSNNSSGPARPTGGRLTAQEFRAAIDGAKRKKALSEFLSRKRGSSK